MRAPVGTWTVVVFQVGIGRYALPVARCRAVSAPQEVTPLPEARGWMLGLREVRGRSLPVVSLRHWLGLGPGEGRQRWLLADLDDATVALAVDHVLGVFTFREADLRPSSGGLQGLLPAVARRFFHHPAGLLVELDPEALAVALGLREARG